MKLDILQHSCKQLMQLSSFPLTRIYSVYSLFSALIMHVYQMRSSVPSVVSSSQERISVCMNALKEVSKVWLVAKMVHTLFESILGNKALEERLHKAAGKRAQKNKTIQGAQANTQPGPKNTTAKRKYEEIDLSFSAGPPAPQVSYERSRPPTPSVTPSRDLGPQQPINLGTMSSPPLRNATDHFLPPAPGTSHGPSRVSSRVGTRPNSPFNAYSIPASPPDLFLVTRNSPPISQTLWDNFRPDQLFPEGDSGTMHFSPPPPNGSNPVDPQLHMPPQPQQSMHAPHLQQFQQLQHHRDGSDMGGMSGPGLGVPGMGMGGMQPGWPGMDASGGLVDAGYSGSQQDDQWSNSSRGNAPIVPTALNVEDW
jgi:hypothetical protein